MNDLKSKCDMILHAIVGPNQIDGKCKKMMTWNNEKRIMVACLVTSIISLVTIFAACYGLLY